MLEFLLPQGQGGKGLGKVAQVLVMRHVWCDICMIYARDKMKWPGLREAGTDRLDQGEVSPKVCGAHTSFSGCRGGAWTSPEEGKLGLVLSCF